MARKVGHRAQVIFFEGALMSFLFDPVCLAEAQKGYWCLQKAYLQSDSLQTAMRGFRFTTAFNSLSH